MLMLWKSKNWKEKESERLFQELVWLLIVSEKEREREKVKSVK